MNEWVEFYTEYSEAFFDEYLPMMEKFFGEDVEILIKYDDDPFIFPEFDW